MPVAGLQVIPQTMMVRFDRFYSPSEWLTAAVTNSEFTPYVRACSTAGGSSIGRTGETPVLHLHIGVREKLGLWR